MINLVRNENTKIYRRTRTWIFFVAVLLGVIAIALVINQNMRVTHVSEDAWKFATTSSSLMSLVTIFTAVIAGDILASEFGSGTIKLLLIRPVSRTKILVSKYFSVLLFAFLFAIGLMIVSWVIGGFFFGFGGPKSVSISPASGTAYQIPASLEMLRSFAFECVPLLMTVTVSFMISALFRSSSLAIAISILLLFVGETISGLLSRFSWDKFILFTNESLSQYFEGQPLVKGMALAFSITVLAVYFIVFHVVAWVAFTRRDVTA
ncbi:ABC transporter permease [Alicyclobacillus dauci]|uniref:ABC transporter permease n=1 Tax=Alicyclobacillus dauci TaxID=1475485 RepID=A0ABY6Z7G9_9BACL|nr:ABC transporter permease [Alicyclobacillus dauci]WAH38695.1 ABC transporter permease [Alicyclobacillus dauci]